MEHIRKRKIDEDVVAPFPNPEELMPLPDRLKEVEKPEESAEAQPTSLSVDSEASTAKDVSTEPEVVETDSDEIIKARKNTHQAMLRR